ncbi:unnamed protein product [Brachionus calyciflorus]|uniref:Uncharacterized protein n=1 Tax=Brachionus calyciflorus TaxID=104777 RepID=A0A813XCQ3_9BILA|nr:unnamed protein product [Brachionus calyciflorus]
MLKLLALLLIISLAKCQTEVNLEDFGDSMDDDGFDSETALEEESPRDSINISRGRVAAIVANPRSRSGNRGAAIRVVESSSGYGSIPIPIPVTARPAYTTARPIPIPVTARPAYTTVRPIPIPVTAAPSYTSVRPIPIPVTAAPAYTSVRPIPIPVTAAPGYSAGAARRVLVPVSARRIPGEVRIVSAKPVSSVVRIRPVRPVAVAQSYPY